MSHRPNLTAALLLMTALVLALPACGDSSGGGTSADPTDGDTNGDADTSADVATDDVSADSGPAEDTPPAGPPCNPLTQEGCEEGLKCTYDSFDNIVCDEAGTKPLGETCSGTGDCAAGTICLNLNATDSYCYAFCKIDAHCAPGAECLSLESSSVKVCEIDGIYDFCTLLSDTCDADKGCYWAGDEAPICLPAGTGDSKDECESPNDCLPSHTCINKRCLPLCKTVTPQPCGDAFTQCSSYYPPQQIGYCDI